ncbi:MAG TPA: hypothetical protein PLE99_15675 [Candidatus Thiothrix moscowensis]|uniref:hypothetical protein n=1 Tax=unclassified Thiothrix TaxID=2636184 RepID=UPI0025E1BCF3|nr:MULTISPECIES: hypothetical protein [unclassified Thiothrix]HRJ54198.1 hypothetical protein [Candidatus Thiothrix moscowensis]HRJ94464.1 hypothetical protein [Candidatus Thiothrix moscowensis]
MYIPQDHTLLKTERIKYFPKSQTTLAQAMTEELQRFGIEQIHQSRISELLSGDKTLSIIELLVMAKLFHRQPHELLKSELQHYCVEGEGISVRAFASEAESDAYLTELEHEGRILAFGQFPSFLFYTDSQPLRQEQFNQPSFENREFYTLDAYINFLFSVSSRYTLQKRIDILTRYIEYFDPTKKGSLNKKNIVFFSRHAYPTLSRFANMEFFPKKELIIVLAPILQESEGDIFLEIRNIELCRQVAEFYSEKIEPLANPMMLLRLGRKILQQRINDKMPLETAIRSFYYDCQNIMFDSTDPDTILRNFSPEFQEMLTQP